MGSRRSKSTRKKCVACRIPFPLKHPAQKYCGNRCQSQGYKTRHRDYMKVWKREKARKTAEADRMDTAAAGA